MNHFNVLLLLADEDIVLCKYDKKSSYFLVTALFLICDPDAIRTHDPQLRRLLLYPAELPDPAFAVAKVLLFIYNQKTFLIILSFSVPQPTSQANIALAILSFLSHKADREG